MVLILVVLHILVQGCLAEKCTKDVWRSTLFGPYLDTTSFTCSDGCCGGNYNRYCCPSKEWSVSVIVGVTIGAIIGLCCIIAVVIFIIKMCTKSGTQGRVVQPAHNMNVWASNSGAYPGPGYATTEAGMPPPYYGPGSSSGPTAPFNSMHGSSQTKAPLS